MTAKGVCQPSHSSQGYRKLVSRNRVADEHSKSDSLATRLVRGLMGIGTMDSIPDELGRHRGEMANGVLGARLSASGIGLAGRTDVPLRPADGLR